MSIRCVSIGNSEYFGWAIASREAIYLVIERTAAQQYLGASAGGLLGVVGAAVAGAAVELAGGPTAEGHMKFSELPREIRLHPSWPVRNSRGIVYVTPRESVVVMRYPWWGALEIAGKRRVSIVPFCLRRFAVLRYLRETGWDVSK